VTHEGADKIAIYKFTKFIEDIELLDIPLIGRRYTWYKTNETKNIRIDRIMVARE